MAHDSKTQLSILGNVVVAHLIGTESGMPAASAILTGARYFATDTHVEFYCDGSAWNPILDPTVMGWNGTFPFFEGVARNQGGGWTTANALATGVALASGIWLPKGAVLSKLAAWVGTAGVQGTTSGQHSYLALYDTADNLLCYTADATSTNRTANSYFESAITKNAAGGTISSFTITASGVYQISLMWALGTGGSPSVPVLRGFNTNLAALSGGKAGNGKSTQAPMARTHGSGLTYPPPSTIASPTNVAAGAWVAAY